jgi:WD40 repeat protein
MQTLTHKTLPAAIVFATSVILGSTMATRVGAEEAAKPAAKITYDEHVRPIFREHCFSCHNQDSKKSDLSLATFASVSAGGSTGQVIEPGDPDSSRLWSLVSHAEEPKMPPNQDKLPQAKLDVIKAWLLGGALENDGSVAKIKKKPAIAMSASAGAAKPEGPPPMPEKLPRQPVVYTPRASAITALAASPWAPLIAVGGQKQITLYHSDSGAFLGVLPFSEGVPHVLKFSRSGTLLLAGGGIGAKSGSAVVYEVKTGNRVFEVGDELDVVLAADINEDHTRIALGGPGRVVRVFSTADGALVHEIRKHTEWIYALEFSPDGVLLATADRNGGMFVWESETAREFQNLAGHKGAVTDISWRIDSNVLASSSEDGTNKLWEMEGGKEIKSWAAHAGGASAIEFAKDGKLVSVGRDKLTKVWDANGALVREFAPFGDIATEVAFTHDAARVAAGDWLGEVRLSVVADGKQIANLPANPPTLEMLVQAQTAAAAALAEAAKKAAAELAAAEAVVAEKAKASKAAADAAAAAQASLQSLLAEKAAADQAQSAQASASK